MVKKMSKKIKDTFSTAKDFTVDLSTEGIKEFVEFAQGFNIASLSVGKKGKRITVTKNVTAQPKSAPAPVTVEKKALDLPKQFIKSTYVGSFHPVKGIAAGAKVKQGAVVAKIFSMKIEHTIKAAQDCTIQDVLVNEGEPIEYGKPLFTIA